MTKPCTLHVERIAGAIRYRLEPSGENGINPLEGFVTQPISDEELAEAQAKAMSLLRSRPSSSFPAEARARGRMLHSALVPPQLRDDLAAIRGPLLVSTTVFSLPVELFFEDEFWGLHYALGRRLLVEGKPAHRKETRPSAGLRVLLVCSDPRGDIPFVHDEAERVFESLAAVAEVDLIGGTEASFDNVVTGLGKQYDVIHYCGHIVASGAASGLLLADGRVLSGAVIARTLHGDPVVFLNGCASSRSEVTAVGDAWEQDVRTVTHGFALGGARAVIGTASDVGDADAAVIAMEFYRRAIAGEPLGESLRHARLHGRRHAPDSPSWLSFVLHGDPGMRLVGDGGSSAGETRGRRTPPAEPAPPPRERQAERPVARKSRRRVVAAAAIAASVVIAGTYVWQATNALLYLEVYRILYFDPAEAGRKRVVEIADRLHGQGRYSTERWFRERALALTTELRGERDLDTAAQQNNLAEVHRSLGDPAQAVALYRAAADSLAELGAGSAARARVWSNLGLALDALGRFDESARSHRRALALHASLPKSVLASVFNNLGLLERHRGDMDAALKWYRRSRRIYLESVGTDNSGYMTSLNNMCALYADPRVERPGLAEASCREALQRARTYLPVAHPDRVTTVRNLSSVLRSQGRELEADDLERSEIGQRSTRRSQPD